MPKRREPTDLVVAKGRKHFTKRDIEERRAQELDVPFKNIEAPKHLKKSLVKEFYDIAYKLLEIGVMTELDEEALARYLISKELHITYTAVLEDTMLNPKVSIEEITKLMNAQDKAFKQVRQSAADLGLTITSRCKLTIPEAKNKYVEL